MKLLFAGIAPRLWQFIFLGTCVLIAMWTIPGTIALRNILLSLLGMICFCLMISNPGLRSALKSPAMFAFLLLFIYVLAHFFFLETQFDLQLKELYGLWFRTGFAILIGVAFAYYFCQKGKHYTVLLVFLATVVVINLLTFGLRAAMEGKFEPGVMGQPFYKIETVFWGAILTAYSIGNLVYILRATKGILFVKQSWPYFLLICCSMLSAYASSAKNGILINVILMLLFLGHVLIFTNYTKYKFAALFVLIGVLGVIIARHVEQSPGWSTLFQDAALAWQVDDFDNWQSTATKGLPPGVSAGNTYERVAWIAVGIQLLAERPWGFGLVNNSFDQLLTYLNIAHITSAQTHTGWVDWALAFGLPGLMLLGFIVLYILKNTLWSKSQNASIAFWVTLAITIMGCHAEIFYKQFFEASLFFFAFSATIAKLQVDQGRIHEG
jgi:hypothetical protein